MKELRRVNYFDLSLSLMRSSIDESYYRHMIRKTLDSDLAADSTN